MKQMALTERGNEKIVEAVVVVVANRNPHTEHWNRESGLRGNIGERTVVIVVIELGRRLWTRMSGPICAVGKQDVGPAVVVVVNEGAARAHGFREIFFSKCAVVVGEVNAGLGSDVAKGDLGFGKQRRNENEDESSEHYLEFRVVELTSATVEPCSTGRVRAPVPTWFVVSRAVLLTPAFFNIGSGTLTCSWI